jgi:hypothetical protein
MSTFGQRVLGAALLDVRVYEEVEADSRANLQAVLVVLLASVAGGIGLNVRTALSATSLLVDLAATLIGWMAWASLTYLIGTHLLPERQTEATAGQLLRTIAFSAAPGILRVFGAIPVVGALLYTLISLWMLAAMVVAVRQALDYKSLSRAIGVCLVGWALSFVIAAIIGIVFAPAVS